MPLNQSWIRIDVVRHFEGIPRTTIRDIVSVSKAKDNVASLEVAKQLGDIDGAAAHKLVDHPQHKESIWNKILGGVVNVGKQILPGLMNIGAQALPSTGKLGMLKAGAMIGSELVARNNMGGEPVTTTFGQGYGMGRNYQTSDRGYRGGAS